MHQILFAARNAYSEFKISKKMTSTSWILPTIRIQTSKIQLVEALKDKYIKVPIKKITEAT